ncbi:MAG TPA: FAD:protein FMN transferase [Bradyrhizobium sp.]|nr:FAD:protein FMN transferase [Bradyrhizobium sp.]
MACQFEITFAASDAPFVPAAQAALNQIDEIEAQLTVFRSTSAIADLNRRAANESVACDGDLFALLTRCEALSRATGGAFDITSTPLSRCWGFLRREGRLPADPEIASARDVVGMQHVMFDGPQSRVRFGKPGVELNLGAVGKGYALDVVATTLRQRGVGHALLSAGRSSLLAIGGRGRGWPVDIVSARRPWPASGGPKRAERHDRPIARAWLHNQALGTSGAGEQFVEVDGRRFGHVLDPRTGWPTDAMLSASVVCASAADADALSTAFLVGGPSLAERYCNHHPEVLALLTPNDGSGTTLVIGHQAGADVEKI